MRWMLQYRSNKKKCVFKSLRKLSLVTLGSLKLSSNEFQAVLYTIIHYYTVHIIADKMLREIAFVTVYTVRLAPDKRSYLLIY